MSETKYIVSTRHIQILINSSDKEEKNKHYGMLRLFADECRKAANFIVNQQHINFNIKERIKIYNPEINAKYEIIEKELLQLEQEFKTSANKERKSEIKLRKKELFDQKKELNESLVDLEKGFYTNSGTTPKGDNPPIQNSTYQLVAKKFSHLPSYVRSSLNNGVFKNLKKDLPEVLKNNKTVRTYRSKFIPFQKQAIRGLKFNPQQKEFEFSFLNIPIVTNLGRDRSNNYIILERVVSGEYPLCDSSIILKDNKFFLSLVFKTPVEINTNLSNDISVGVDLGVEIPVFVTSSNDKWGTFFGNKKALFHKKQAFRKQKQALQKSISESSEGGHGYKTKMKKLNDLSNAEKNYTQTLFHTLAKNVIDYAISQNAGVIKLEFLEGINENDSKLKPLVRFWSPRKLQTLIEEKAAKYNIQVLYIDPYHTSQTCSCCGHYEEGQRNNRQYFVCKNPLCSKIEKKQHADRNASVNICNSKEYVLSKEDCKISKLLKENKKEKATSS
jgi:IS605 OrfB family transposase